MAVANPIPDSTFTEAALPADPPDIAQAGFIVGCAEKGPLLTPRFYGSGPSFNAVFGESMGTRAARVVFALDAAQHPVGYVRAATTTPGEFVLDTSAVNGTATITASVTPTPLGDYPGVRLEVVTSGVVGVPGIVLRASTDDGRTFYEVGLGAATSFEWPGGLGLKVDITGAGDTLLEGDVVVGYSIPPAWDTNGLTAALGALSTATNSRFSLIFIAEALAPADGATISAALDALALDGVFPQVIANKRRQYRAATPATITATFANANPDTLTRSAGSWITDGFKAGMSVTITDSVSNDGTYLRIASLTATVLTFTANVAFAAEAATANVIVTGEETDDDYAFNIEDEWASYSDTRVSLVGGTLRAVSPPDNSQMDNMAGQYLFAECVAEPPNIEPGQVATVGTVGGPVASKLSGRLYEDTARIAIDARKLPAFVTAPSRICALMSQKDRRPGAFWVLSRTQYGATDQCDTLVKGRLRSLWEATALTAEIDNYLSGFGADPANFNKLGEKARLNLQNYILGALRTRFRGLISNLDVNPEVDPDNALFAVPTGIIANGRISVKGKIITQAYILGFDNFLSIRSPGQV